jgi:hypothetical protein
MSQYNNLTEFLRENFSEIICRTKNRFPENYDVIQLDKFLELKFQIFNNFIPVNWITEVRNTLKNKYGNDNDCIKEYGIRKVVKINELKFYQHEVGIDGPKHSKIDEPVCIVFCKYGNILLNGYHRILIHLLNSEVEVDSNYLKIELNDF